MDVTLGGRSIILTKVEPVRIISMERALPRSIVMERAPERVLHLTGVGLQGVQGERGFTGEQGIQGIQGLKGDQGDQGIQGVQGIQGEKGDTGAKGDKGETGDQGPRGFTGDQGIQGIKGDTGSQGIQGLKGDKGDKGDQGIQGPVGADSVVPGPKGDTGAQGLKGDTGLQGIQGAKGDKGDTGAQGIQGPIGLTGAKGDTGNQGIQGPIGLTGAKGDTGSQGLQGVKGDTGAAGTNGTNGAQGIQGVKGDTGAQGPQGVQGPQGATGPAPDVTVYALKANPQFTGTGYIPNLNVGGALTAGATSVSSLTLGNNFFYSDNGSQIIRTGVGTDYKYFRLDANGDFSVLNGSIAASGRFLGQGLVATGMGGIHLRQKDSGSAAGKALLHYKDTSNYYMLLTNQDDADGSFNGYRPFVLNLTNGMVTMNNGVEVGSFFRSYGPATFDQDINAGGSVLLGASGAASSTLMRKGSIELREASPYIDFSRDGSVDYHARIQSTPVGSFSFLANGGEFRVGAGGNANAFSADGVQYGTVVTTAGSQQTMTKSVAFTTSGDPFASAAGTSTEAEMRGAGGANPAVHSYHRPGAFGAFFGLRSDNEFAVGGWSMGANSWKVWTQRNFDPATKLNTDSLDVGDNANKVIIRDGEGSANVRNIKTRAEDGLGLRLWGGNSDFSVYMSSEGSGTWGGNVANANGADYNMYFRMAGTDRGWVFYNGAPKLKIDGNGGLHANGKVATNEWFRQYGTGGWYNHSYNQGVIIAGAGGNPYGNLSTYGAGINGWQGFNILSSGLLTWMSDGNSVGLHHNGNSWLINGDMAGNFTFRGNVTAFSDLRLKNVLGTIDNAKERRDNLAEAAIIYTRKDNESGRVRVGYGAQTLRDGANPELVLEADDAMKLVTGTGTLSVDYGEATAILAVASKETDDEVARLRKQVEELSRLVARLLDDGK